LRSAGIGHETFFKMFQQGTPSIALKQAKELGKFTRSYLINGFRPFQMEELSIFGARTAFVLQPFCLVAFCSIGPVCKIFIFMI
jgi:hypothetical protein